MGSLAVLHDGVNAHMRNQLQIRVRLVSGMRIGVKFLGISLMCSTLMDVRSARRVLCRS